MVIKELRVRYAILVNVGLSVRRPSVRAAIVRCPFGSRISETKQDGSIVTMKHYIEVGTADSVATSRSSPDAFQGDRFILV